MTRNGNSMRLEKCCLAVVAFIPLTMNAQNTRPQQAQSTLITPGPAIEQSSMDGRASTINMLSTTVQISGPYATSVLAPDSTGSAIRLTVEEAIERGLRYNLGIISASEARQSSQYAFRESLSSLLPTVSAAFSENVNKVSLASEGFSAASIPSIGSYFPSTIGPFHYYSAQANVEYAPFDLVALHNALSSQQQVKATQFSEQDARDQIVVAIAAAYLQGLVQQNRVDSARMQVKYAQALYDQAVEQKSVGTRSSIEVNRSRLQLQSRQQQLLAQQGDMEKLRMRFARMIGFSSDQELEFTDSLNAIAQGLAPLDSLYLKAEERPDIRAAMADLKAAEESRRAAAAERLPNVKLQGFFGLQGPTLDSGKAIYSGTSTISIPLFNGGQIRNDIRQSELVVEKRRNALSARIADVRFNVHTAWINQDTATKQFLIANDNQILARQILQQSMDRYKVGAADSVEVAQSQDMLAGAEEEYINSLFSVRIAEMNLARAIGSAENEVAKIVKGVHP